jgi:hypothetical protein
MWLYKRRKRKGGNRSAKASVKSGMSSRLGIIRIDVRGPLCQTSEKGVEDLATVWYPKFVKWSPTREEK